MIHAHLMPESRPGASWAYSWNIILSWGLEVLRNGGPVGIPRTETSGAHTIFLDLSKVLGGEPQAVTCLLKCW
jgi:hypothetical protein